MTASTAVATWYVVKGSNDTYWRVDVPAKAIGAAVCKVPFLTGEEQFAQPGLFGDRAFRWYLTDDGAAYPDHEGNAVFGRPDQARATHALAMKAEGARIVAEVDDDYLAPTRQNISMRLRYDERSRELFLKSLACFDAVIVTTLALRHRYWWALKQLGPRGKRPKVEFHVCGNHVDPDDWPEAPPKSDRLRVGWMGSDSHFRDVKLAYPALKWAADQGHEVVIIGYDPRWHPQAAATDSISGLKKGDHFGFPYTLIPWVDPATFDRPRVAWPIDVALAPLERTTFNLGKSDVKWLEYTMSGAATVASSSTVYDEIKHGETGFLASSPEEFLLWTKELCENASRRRDVVEAATEYARSKRLIGQHADEWREAICPA